MKKNACICIVVSFSVGTINLFLIILKNTLPLHQIKVPPLEMIAELMAALWEVFLFCKCKVSDYSLAFCFYMGSRL